MPAPATPCTRRSTRRGWSPISPRSACPCSRWRVRREAASSTSCAPSSAAASRPTASTALAAYAGNGYDVAFVVADGLSARAVAAHAQPLLAEIFPRLRDEGWRMAPLTVVRHGRVAIGDAVAAALAADIAVVLIGERPGLSAPDSMGAYLTWRPTAATTDAERNCISNIRPAGLPYGDAAFTLVHLLRAMRGRRLSGFALKDDGDRLLLDGR